MTLSIPATTLSMGQPTGHDGRQWAREELTKRDYAQAGEAVLERIGRAFSDFIHNLIEAADPGGKPWLIIFVVLAVVAVVFVIVWRLRRGSSIDTEDHPGTTPLFENRLDPVALRESAHAHAAAGRLQEAVQDRVRAVFADLMAAQIISLEPASTATELASDGSAAIPASSSSLHTLAKLFNEVSFSPRTAAASDYQLCLYLDAATAQHISAHGPDRIKPHRLDHAGAPRTAGSSG